MFLKKIKNKDNLIILNGQLKYYQHTLSYWKKFSEINKCQFLIISQDFIHLKNSKKEKINHNLLKRSLKNYTFIEIDSTIDEYINLEIDILESSIQEHNSKFNQTN